MNGYIPSMWSPSSVTLTMALESECSPSVLVTLLTWKMHCLFRSMRRSVTCSDCSEPCVCKSEADMDKIARTHTRTHLCLFRRTGKVPPSARLKPSNLLWLDYSTVPLTICGSSLPITGAPQPVWMNVTVNFLCEKPEQWPPFLPPKLKQPCWVSERWVDCEQNLQST